MLSVTVIILYSTVKNLRVTLYPNAGNLLQARGSVSIACALTICLENAEALEGV